MIRPVAVRLATCGLFCLAVLGLAARARAGLGDEARAVEKKLVEVRAAGKWDGAAESALVGSIESIASRYHRLAQSGTVSDARTLSSTIRGLLERAQDNYGAELKRWQARIISEDGDLEGAQDSPQWQEREALAARVQYWLDWVHYLAAARFERASPERRQWLQDALEGFSSFASQDQDRRLAAESLFGRGLTLRELGRYEEAAADLRRAAQIAPEAEARMRAQMALADLLLQRKDYGGALAASAGLASRPGAFGAEREFLRSQVILLALKAGAIADAGGRSRLRSEAARLLERLSARGGGWADRGRKLFASSIDDPAAWGEVGGGWFVKWVLAESLRSRGDWASALRLYGELLAGKPPPEASRASLLLSSGICNYKLERYRDALEHFDRAVRATAEREVPSDALYLRFKAAEALYFNSHGAEDARVLETAIAEYLRADPRHRYRFEAYYRLGELQAEQGRFRDASNSFSQVEGTARFTLKARFLAAQTLVQELDRWWKSGQSGAEGAKLADEALAKIREFRGQAAKLDKPGKDTEVDRALVSSLVLKSALMEAKLRKHRDPPDWAGVLEAVKGLEKGDEGESRTRAELMAARVEALLHLGQAARAQECLADLIALCKNSPSSREPLRDLGVVFLEAAQGARAAGDSVLVLKTSEMALAIYELLLSAAGSGDTERDRIPGLESIVSQLRQEISRLRREAG